VSADAKRLVDLRKADLIDGTLQVFQGPLYDNTGVLRVPAGEFLNGDDLLTTADWVVEGVTGQLN
jgi:hypothetical protein